MQCGEQLFTNKILNLKKLSSAFFIYLCILSVLTLSLTDETPGEVSIKSIFKKENH